MRSLARVVKKGAVSIKVIRMSAGGYDANGRAVAPTETSLTIEMWNQPVSGDDLQRLPEGLRTQEVIKLYALAELRAGDRSTGRQPDELLIDGLRWQVEQVWNWSEDNWATLDGRYWKALAIRKGQ